VEAVRRKQIETGNKNFGYDVLADEFVDLVQRGVIDPAKVTRSAVENASSIAGMILTTEALVTEIPEKEKAPAPQMPEY
jgi:chaperonin GroEL